MLKETEKNQKQEFIENIININFCSFRIVPVSLGMDSNDIEPNTSTVGRIAKNYCTWNIKKIGTLPPKNFHCHPFW
jgi:hypothetical protein